MRAHCIRAVLTLTLLLASPITHALNVAGTYTNDVTWTTNDSPYVLTGALTVQFPATLTIQPGVAVQFATNVLLTVRGTLQADGSPEQPIAFSAAPGLSARGGIFIDGSNATLAASCSFSFCDFTRLQASPAVLRTAFAHLQIADCTFSNIAAKVIFPFDSRLNMVNNVMHDTQEAINAVRCAGLIAHNHISKVSGDADAIDIDFGWSGPEEPNLVLEWNHVEGGDFHNADGIDLGTSRNLIMRNNVMRNFGDKGLSIGEDSEVIAYNNWIEDCITGVAIKDSSRPLLANFTVVNCTVGVDNYEKGAGLGGGNGSITNFIIWNCTTGILLDSLSQIAVGYSIVPGDTVWPGPGNLNTDPEFKNPAGADYRLRPGSPAIDSATPLTWMTGAPDLASQPRVAGSGPDRGAYEYVTGPLDANFTATPTVGPAPLSVVFHAAVAGTNLTGLTYAWDFDGDGFPELTGPGLATVTNVYEAFGWHSPALTVSNAIGETFTTLRPNSITVNGPVDVYVSPTGLHQYPFTNWLDAATNIADALSVAFNGTVVWVTNGTYLPPAELLLEQNLDLRSVNGAAVTVLDGQNVRRLARLNHPQARLQGFTLRSGRAVNGGGLYLQAGRAEDCVLELNIADALGGGAYLEPGTEMARCFITNNQANTSGGGVYLTGGLVDQCRIADNRVTASGADGGGAYLNGGGTLRNCLLIANNAADRGGGVYLLNGGILESSTIVSNTATFGGGTRCFGGGTVRNSIIINNTALDGANTSDGGSGFQYTYTCSIPGLAGAGNIAESPNFDPSGNWRLSSTSPCVNAGQNQPWMPAASDLAGFTRITGPAVDLGAYESTALNAYFEATPTSGFAPLTNTLTATISGTNLLDLHFQWDLDGDGNVDLAGEGLTQITNVYAMAGLYDVELTVSNAIGEVDTFRRSAYINVAPPILYVSPTGSHTPPFDSWPHAATNLASALTQAIDNTRIEVAAGNYPIHATLALTRAVTLVGIDGTAATVLDGLGVTQVMQVAHTDAHVSGFTITGGRAVNGGGLQVDQGRVESCLFTENLATSRGGGVYVGAAGAITACVITNNQSRDTGGGLHLIAGALAERCLIASNLATNRGGGVYLNAGGVLRNCVVTGNRAIGGGGVTILNSGLAENCTIVNNTVSSPALGGGLRISGAGSARNTIVVDNTLPNTFTNSTSAVLRHLCTTPAVTGLGNITNPPGITATNDWQLPPGSPCIDAGTNQDWMAGAADYANFPRVLDGNNDGTSTVDIGALEYLHPTADSDHDGQPDSWELAQGLLPLVDDAGDDPDQDGVDNIDEFVAGTSPTNNADFFHISAVASAINAVSIEWLSVSGRSYQVYRTDALNGTWSNVAAFAGTGSPATYTNLFSTPTPNFYRIGVTLP